MAPQAPNQQVFEPHQLQEKHHHQPFQHLSAQVSTGSPQQQPYSGGASLHLAEDGSIVLPQMEGGNSVQHQHQIVGDQQPFMGVQAQHGQQQHAQASNKVLLVLPGGQMILTDLTDEQCVNLNIQVSFCQGEKIF